jgi:hypothetical protein
VYTCTYIYQVKLINAAIDNAKAGSRLQGLPHVADPSADVVEVLIQFMDWNIASSSERRSAIEAIRRFTNQSPGCRQGTILAPVAAWQPLPGSEAVSDILEGRRDLGVARGT